MRASIAFSADDNDDNDVSDKNNNNNNDNDDYQFLENYHDHTYPIRLPSVAAPFSKPRIIMIIVMMIMMIMMMMIMMMMIMMMILEGPVLQYPSSSAGRHRTIDH